MGSSLISGLAFLLFVAGVFIYAVIIYNGLIRAGARVYYAMACDGLFFKKIAKLNSRHVPAVALIAQGIWACLLTLPRTTST